jgi:Icc-related predicted phosphoesterase
MRVLTRRQKHSGNQRATTRVFFATDIHGSEQCFRKFLNAGPFYGVDHLILGGDITGKSLVPIIRKASHGYDSVFGEEVFRNLDERGRQSLEELIRRRGQYPVLGSLEEIQALEDPEYRDRVFRSIVYQSMADWVTLADERLRGSGRLCFVAPGNDDYLEIDRHLQGSEHVIFCEAQRVWLDERHEMITTGYSNETPWKTERELTEEVLRKRLDDMATDVNDFANLVAVLHSPPYASELDSAPELDENMRMRMQGGSVRMVPVGSHAVRSFIEDAQPLLGLHGHVHESRGAVYVGRTLCINPGSEYPDGILSGAIVELGSGVVVSHQLVAG